MVMLMVSVIRVFFVIFFAIGALIHMAWGAGLHPHTFSGQKVYSDGGYDVAADDTLTWRPAEVYPATKEYQVPDFTLKDYKGETVRLHDYRGKVVLLNIWATWCPPCREEVPELVKLQREYGESGLQVIGVSIDENGAEDAVSDFAGSHDINYPVPVDDGSVQKKYGPLSVIPTTYILDADGYLRFYAPGYLEYEQMEEAVRELLDL